jgi:hypothetical protein
MNSKSTHLRLFFSALLFVSNLLAVLHLHEFFPASHVHVVSDLDVDSHRVVQEEILCPLHYVAQGAEAISSPVEPHFEPDDVHYTLIDHQVDIIEFVSGKSSRARPSLA